MITLVKDTIDQSDINRLIEWLKTNPRLTKGYWTTEFEEQWSRYIGCKYSVFVNSGSSANLMMLYAVKLLKKNSRIFNNRIIIPAVSWATDLSPAIQLGYKPYLCDASKENLGVDVNHFEQICKKNHCKTAIVVHVLGIPANIYEIKNICEKYGVILLEDSCESVGTTSNGILTGRFGLMSSFSFYFGHHMSTIEGGMICTDNKEVYDLLKMLRSHGWDRDLDKSKQVELRKKHKVNDFEAMYTFYVPGFNFRSTDLQAFIGIKQIGNLYKNNQKRFQNFLRYQNRIKNEYWKLPYSYDFISNFAYPIIHPNRKKIVKDLIINNVECRPLICGSLANQPFAKNIKLDRKLIFADIIHKYGMYVPNHPYLTNEEIDFISDIINYNI